MTAPGGDDMRRRLHRLPKAELHVHLDGSLRPATLLELAAEAGQDLPAADAERLGDFMHVRDARDLVDYLARFEITLAVMQTAEALERIAYELAEDLAGENVRYAEIRFSPVLHIRGGLTLAETVDAPLRGLRQAERDFGIRAAIIVCGIRSLGPEVSLELAELTTAYRGRGVVAFDLAGAEHGAPAVDHLEAFRFVRRHEMGVTIHAGEAFGPESIRQALHDCGAHRIGHGTRLSEDRSLLHYVRDFRVPLEICLSSNIQTRVASAFHEHPLRPFFENDLVLSLNTDNRLMSGTTLTQEYWHAHLNLGFSWEDLCALALMAFESAFLPWDEKRRLLAEVRNEIETLP